MNDVRIAGRMLARELNAEELSGVAGGATLDFDAYRPTMTGSPDEFNEREDDCGV